ncbi:hypothetical protein V3C99_016808 [Haemonchus contortus]
MNVEQRKASEHESPYSLRNVYGPHEDNMKVEQIIRPVEPDYKRNFIVRSGFAYYHVTLKCYEGMNFGLFVKHYRNQVIVTKVENASAPLQSLDHIIQVNGMPVSDKDVCKTLMVNALQRDSVVNLLIERPIDPAAKELMENALTVSIQQPPSVTMASDVKSILRRYVEKLNEGHGQMEPDHILSRPDKNKNKAERSPRQHIKIDDKKNEMLIGMDHENERKPLQKVPQKTPPLSRSQVKRKHRKKKHLALLLRKSN